MTKREAFSGEVHEIAAMLPLLTDEELADLAADIGENGLREPIKVTPDGVLIDGRNRLAACGIAGVEPRFEAIADEPVAYIRSREKRRHRSPGSRAMFEVVCEAAIRNIPNRPAMQVAKDIGVDDHLIAWARLVYAEAPELIQQVLDGGSLHDAGEAALVKRQMRKSLDSWERASKKSKAAYQEAQQAEVKRLADAVQRDIEAIGPSVPIVAPEMVQPPQAMQQQADPSITNLADVQTVLAELRRVKDQLASMAGKEPVRSEFWPEGFHAAVHSAVSQIVATAYDIAAQYNRNSDPIRRVK